MWRSLGRTIEEYCKKKNIQHALEEARVVRYWQEVLTRTYGDQAPLTKVYKLQNKTLYVWADEPMWVGELERNKRMFSQRIREETGYVLENMVFLYKYLQ